MKKLYPYQRGYKKVKKNLLVFPTEFGDVSVPMESTHIKAIIAEAIISKLSNGNDREA